MLEAVRGIWVAARYLCAYIARNWRHHLVRSLPNPGDGMQNPFFFLIDTLLWLYLWAVIIYVIVGWLVAFNVINQYQPFVRQIMTALDRLTRPVLDPMRRFLPDLGGIDLSPLLLIILIQFFRLLVARLFFG
ncbi:MAG: YggT family protein [Pseudomonadota bacterium]